MPARSGQEYLDSLKPWAPCVYLGGRRVSDITAEPIFQEPIRAIAEQYDMHFDPAYREVMTFPLPTTGHPVSTSALVPYTREKVVKKRKQKVLRVSGLLCWNWPRNQIGTIQRESPPARAFPHRN